MKRFRNAIKLSALIFVLIACSQENEDTTDKSFPVEWFLSDQDKIIFQPFSNNMLLQYSDADNNILDFYADSIYEITTCLESNLDKGEALSVRYNCLMPYFPNYSFNCRLAARPDQSVDLSIIFGTGTYWNEGHNDYILSSFLYNPHEPADTSNYFGHQINSLYLDSINLRDTTIYNVFQGSNVIINTDLKQTIKCYYTVDDGVVAFENNDGKLWIRK